MQGCFHCILFIEEATEASPVPSPVPKRGEADLTSLGERNVWNWRCVSGHFCVLWSAAVLLSGSCFRQLVATLTVREGSQPCVPCDHFSLPCLRLDCLMRSVVLLGCQATTCALLIFRCKILPKSRLFNEHLITHRKCFVTDKEAVTLKSVHSLVRVSIFIYMTQFSK